jgi:metallo-beta-lactamase class B
MPELGRTRRVWIYLPPGYSAGTSRYPVLYMQDGQFLFHDSTSFLKEWRVDESLDSLAALGDPGVIVVAVDHGGLLRTSEYSPWRHPLYGGGEGAKYADFLVNTLKPCIDSAYRTLPDRENTGIAGSSLGGLISLYAAVRYPDVFGKAGIFSPALWFSPEVFAFVRSLPATSGSRFYFVSGALEGPDAASADIYVRDQKRMIDVMIAGGVASERNVMSREVPEGRHSERLWREEFPAAYRWLFAR